LQSEGSAARYRGTAETRRKILAWREKDLSAGEIAQLLSEDGVDISVRMAERVLAKKGFPKLPRRTRLKIGLTVKEAEVPQKMTGIVIEQMEVWHFVGDPAGVFLFAPFLEKFQAPELIRSAGLPGTKVIPAVSYFLPFLALKLISTERYAPLGGHAFDPGLGLFAVLNVLPKCTAMSTYSYSLDEVHILELQQTFVKNAVRLGLSDGSVINLDFQLNSQGIRFITLRRRNLKLIGNLDELKPREKIHIPHDKRKYPDPYHQSLVALKNYEGQLRQIIIRGKRARRASLPDHQRYFGPGGTHRQRLRP
jgi:hypothetical protein